MFPIIERTDRLLWHPARYEGFECSDNIIYVGAAPNHNVVPLVRYMLNHIADEVLCVGSNYVWTWETNRVTREIVRGAGGRILAERLLELGEQHVEHIINEIITRRRPVVFNTLVGESSYFFMRALHAATIGAGVTIPVLSCSLCEPELKMIGGAAAADCITSSAYFESIDLMENRAFVSRWNARYGADSSPSVDGQSTYVSVMLLARAIERAGSTEVGAVRRAAANYRYESPQGPVWVDPDNNHCFLTPRLARSTAEGQFEIFWQAEAPEKRPRPASLLQAFDPARRTRKARCQRRRGVRYCMGPRFFFAGQHRAIAGSRRQRFNGACSNSPAAAIPKPVQNACTSNYGDVHVGGIAKRIG